MELALIRMSELFVVDPSVVHRQQSLTRSFLFDRARRGSEWTACQQDEESSTQSGWIEESYPRWIFLVGSFLFETSSSEPLLEHKTLDEEESSFFERKRLQMMQNIEMIIENLHISYETQSTAKLGHPFSFGLTLHYLRWIVRSSWSKLPMNVFFSREHVVWKYPKGKNGKPPSSTQLVSSEISFTECSLVLFVQ